MTELQIAVETEPRGRTINVSRYWAIEASSLYVCFCL
jgi:hypothetical protein